MEDKVLNSIKEQRKSLSSAIDNAAQQRDAFSQHTQTATLTYVNILLTVSLALGVAIIPLLLLGGTASVGNENRNFLTAASVLLIVNALYMLSYVKKYTEALNVQALAHGLEDRLMMLKYRNLLTKSILTKDPKYFTEYSRDSREAVEKIANSDVKAPNLDHDSDVGVVILIVGIMLAFRPLVAIDFWAYMFVMLMIVFVVTIYLYKQLSGMRLSLLKIENTGNRLQEEERAFNKFVRDLSSKH